MMPSNNRFSEEWSWPPLSRLFAGFGPLIASAEALAPSTAHVPVRPGHQAKVVSPLQKRSPPPAPVTEPPSPELESEEETGLEEQPPTWAQKKQPHVHHLHVAAGLRFKHRAKKDEMGPGIGIGPGPAEGEGAGLGTGDRDCDGVPDEIDVDIDGDGLVDRTQGL